MGQDRVPAVPPARTLPDVSTGIGDTLRDARQQLGRSIEQAAQDTRVNPKHLRSLEQERFEAIGGDVYAKGFLSTYARYLELDPAPLLEEYRRSVQRDDETTRHLASGQLAAAGSGGPPAWLAWAAVAVVVLAAIVALGELVGGRNPQGAGNQDAPPQPVDTASPSPTSAPGLGTSPTPSPSPSPTPTPEGVEVLLAVEQDCWMQVTIDDEVIFQDTVPSGETRTFRDDRSVTIRFGNAGGVRAEVNGRDLGVVGDDGEVRTVEFTPEGSQSV